jgi:nicotinamidase/pyrazinamidase
MSDPVTLDRDRAALVLIDLQPDFMPGGPLSVQTPQDHPDDILVPTRELMLADAFAVQVATQDWHPPGHISFAGSHPGRRPFDVIDLYGHPQTLWPDHCVRGTPGARLHEDLPLERLTAILRKGEDPRVDSYSGFRNNWNADGVRPSTGLAGLLHERGITQVYCCGLARDVCVKWTALDAAEHGFMTVMLHDHTHPVDADNDPRVQAELTAAGVHVRTAEQVLGG